MEESILISTKKILGLEATYTPFDLDITTHINAAFSLLNQLGVGPVDGFFIEDDSAVWEEFVVPENQLNLIKTYVYLKVRLLFDPPGTSYLIEAANNQIKEYEWRLNIFREEELPPVKVQQAQYLQDQANKMPVVTPAIAGTRWIDVNKDPITGEPMPPGS